jgi:2-C-methyl-D-erythritol 4-phosphate cytidylyltransferase
MMAARPSLAVIVTAGGRGVRLGGEGSKQYVPLLGVPMVQRTIDALDTCPAVDLLVVVVNEEDVPYCSREIVAERFEKVVAVVAGGSERPLSVRNGLRELEHHAATDLIAVHDGARPLVTCDEVGWGVGRLAADPALDGVVLASPAIDTMKVVDEQGLVVDTPPRGRLWRAQTPQIFRRQALMDAYDQPDELLLAATDDAFLVEGRGGRVAVVPGSPENLKITTMTDLRVAEQILAERRR